MPGRQLNDNERRLLRFWEEPPGTFDVPLLKGVTIEGPVALRGIEGLRVPFDYPITGICGRNGVGKSTILALSAFSGRRPREWRVGGWPTLPSRAQPVRATYGWSDFFFRHFSDPPHDGLRIRFTYAQAGNDIEITRRRNRRGWSTVPDPGRSRGARFPERPLEFVTLARILPPSELQGVRLKFGKRRPVEVNELDARTRQRMSYVFGRSYESIEVQDVGGVRLARCSAGSQYSGFDMGAGENAAIGILTSLDSLPRGGLLLVEEIEHGFHPEAQRRLIEVLTEMAWEGRRQIIFTTHSEHVVDSLPRQGRVLLRRMSGVHAAMPGPTTRLAMADMTGVPQPEATIYVEDYFASVLVKYCLPKEVKVRVRVVPVGDRIAVARQLEAHLRGPNEGPVMCVLDGDSGDRDMTRLRQVFDQFEQEARYARLPGGEMPPERWVVRELGVDPYLAQFASRMECSEAEAAEELERLRALQDHHEVPYVLGERWGYSRGEAIRLLVSGIARAHPELDGVRDMVGELVA